MWSLKGSFRDKTLVFDVNACYLINSLSLSLSARWSWPWSPWYQQSSNCILLGRFSAFSPFSTQWWTPLGHWLTSRTIPTHGTWKRWRQGRRSPRLPPRKPLSDQTHGPLKRTVCCLYSVAAHFCSDELYLHFLLAVFCFFFLFFKKLTQTVRCMLSNIITTYLTKHHLDY